MAFTPTIPYADQAYANAYFANRFRSRPWTSASSGDQVAALATSTRAIDKLNFAGHKAQDGWYLADPVPPAPTLSPASGGSLSAGAYQVAIAFVHGVATDNMVPPFATGAESALGPATNVVVPASGQVTISGTIIVPTAAPASGQVASLPGVGYAIYVQAPGSLQWWLAAFVAATGTNTINTVVSSIVQTWAFPSAGNGQTLPCAVQPNQFPRGNDTTVPDAVSQACCELALALLDDVDPNFEIENLSASNQSLGDARLSRDTSYVQEHVRAGIPSIEAWTLLLPFMRDFQHPRIEVERGS
jgi:hypothetical protein